LTMHGQWVQKSVSVRALPCVKPRCFTFLIYVHCDLNVENRSHPSWIWPLNHNAWMHSLQVDKA
jgi:hypothetical protein